MTKFDPRADKGTLFVVGSLVVACCAKVPRCPEPGETLMASGFIIEAGGKGFNVALAAHRLGVRVDGLFAIGDDTPGLFMRTALSGQGLDQGMIVVTRGATGAGVGLVQADGENRIAVFPGANALLSAGHVHAKGEAIGQAELVFAQFEAPDEPIVTAFSLARESGVRTMLNPSPMRRIDDEILRRTDSLVLNAQEAEALALEKGWSADYGEMAQALAALGVGAFIVTCGAAGALAWRQGERIEQPGFQVIAQDSIGAGDAFSGGLIAALIRGEDLATALHWGCAAGALATTRFGLIDALPDGSELQGFLAQ